MLQIPGAVLYGPDFSALPGPFLAVLPGLFYGFTGNSTVFSAFCADRRGRGWRALLHMNNKILKISMSIEKNSMFSFGIFLYTVNINKGHGDPCAKREGESEYEKKDDCTDNGGSVWTFRHSMRRRIFCRVGYFFNRKHRYC